MPSAIQKRAASIEAAGPEAAIQARDALLNLQADPVYFCERFLGYQPWGMQRAILAALSEPQVRIAVKAAHSVGKCARASDIATLADGSEIEWSRLVGRVFDVLTIDDQRQLVTVQAYAEWNVIEPVYRVTFNSGCFIERNAEHPVWSARFENGKPFDEGWRPIARLTGSMRVAVPKNLPVFGTVVMPEAEVRLLAIATAAYHGLMKRSGYLDPEILTDPDLIEEARELVHKFGGSFREVESVIVRYGHNTPSNITKKGWSVTTPRVKGGRRPKELGHNSCFELLMKYGIAQSPAAMRVPRDVWKLHREQLILYLNRFFAVLAKTGPGVLTVEMASRECLNDIQRLLLRFGVHARTEQGVHRFHYLYIDDPEQLATFVQVIGLDDKRKQEVERAQDLENPRLSHTIWHDTMPLVWERVQSIAYVANERTVAVHVPGFETYFSHAAYEHNTNLAAMAALWMTATGGITITTAPTWQQVVRLLWKEIHATYATHKHILGGEMFQSEWRVSETNWALGLSTNEGDRFQGVHSDRVLLIFDEGPGVRPDIWEAAEGIRAGGDVRFLALGNPTAVGNPFHSAFLSAGTNSGWKTFSIPAFITPNFARFPDIASLERATLDELRNVPKPYLTNPRWVLEKYREWGPDSPMYLARVMAEFPTQSEDSLISMTWISQAALREMEIAEQDIIVGIDVAGAGEDETVLIARRGGMLIEEQGWTKPDPREEVFYVLSQLRDKAFEEKVKLRVYVDSIAVGHYFLMDIRKAGYDVTGVNVGGAPLGKDAGKALSRLTALPPALFQGQRELDPGERFDNLKAQLSWMMREAFQTGAVGGKLSDVLQGQLAVLRYHQTAKGKIQIESKDALRSRGVHSPDHAEALMLTYYEGAPKPLSGRYKPVLATGEASSGWFNDDPFGLVESGRVQIV